jgi:hypothetical protein
MLSAADRQDYEVTSVRSFAEMGVLQADWQSLLEKEGAPAFDADPDRYAAILESQAGAHPRPHILLVRKHGEPVAMLLGRVWTIRLKCEIGYLSVSLPPLRCLDVKHGWLLGQITDDVTRVLLDEIGKVLKSSEAHFIRFQGLNTDSPLYKAVVPKSRIQRCGRLGRIETHRTMHIPASLDAFYQSLSQRHRANLRRYARKVEEQYGERAVVTEYTGEAMVDQFGKTAEQVSVKTYQHGLGSGIVYNEPMQLLLKRIAKQGWLRGHILFLDGEPCAFQCGVIYRGRYFLEQIGYDPKWKDLRVGTYLFLHVLRELCSSDSGAKLIDFGPGDAEYKSSYGDKQWDEASVFVFAPRLYPVSVNLLRTCITGLNVVLQRIADKAGVINRLKRRWRDHLQKPTPAVPKT